MTDRSDPRPPSDRGRGEVRTVGWRVMGRVQGVGFRWFVLQAARSSGLEGDVANLSDGRVEVRARGTDEQLDELHAALTGGPKGSRVDGVDAFVLDGKQVFDGFEIRY
jgi:acylphosphatase